MIVENNPLLKGAHGKLGATLVIKQYKTHTVIANYPDMSRIKRTKSQKQENNKFKAAVFYAISILKDAQKKADFQKKLKPGELIYHAAIREYLSLKK